MFETTIEMQPAPSEPKPNHPRRSCRYPIELDLQYRLTAKGCVEQLGKGRTVNISSGGVLFVPNDIQKLAGGLRSGQVVELMLDWPLPLQKICLLKLVVRGEIVRRDGDRFALRLNRYEFRTAGIVAHPGRIRSTPADPPRACQKAQE